MSVESMCTLNVCSDIKKTILYLSNIDFLLLQDNMSFCLKIPFLIYYLDLLKDVINSFSIIIEKFDCITLIKGKLHR